MTAATASPVACSCGLDCARRHLERAIAELEQARLAWGVWADGVRELAEQRTGVSIADGFGLLDEEGYAGALRLGAWFDDAASTAAAALEVTGAGLPDNSRYRREACPIRALPAPCCRQGWTLPKAPPTPSASTTPHDHA